MMRTYGDAVRAWLARSPAAAVESVARRIEVPSTGSIADALRDARPGTEIVVDPGDYREQLTLKSGVRLVSRIPRGATIRLPAATPDAANVPAVIAREITGAELAGFIISGDSATPLAVGILVERAELSIVDVEITGAGQAAVEFSGGGSSLVASDIRDNPGIAIAVRDGARPRISHNTLARNAMADGATAPLVVERGTLPEFVSNVFMTLNPGSFTTLDAEAFASLRQDNWFVAPPARNGASLPRNGLTPGR
jgi:hypothetical protein